MIELKDVVHYVTDKIDVSSLKMEEYITTDNMVPNRGGIVDCESLPQVKRVIKFVPGDVLVSNIRPYFKKIWYADKISGCSNDVIVFRTNDDNWDSKFLYYVLSQNLFFDFMMAGANGTKMPRGNKKTIPDFLVPNFNIEKQRRIANILSAYDGLIENNQKQIKLLEEAAQRLYKEWFVDLRFPGHEDVAIVDGVPDGWKKTNINAVMTFHRGYDLTKDNIVPGKYPVIGSTSIIGYHNQYKINGPGIVTGRSGSLGKYQLIWEDFWPHNTSLYVSDKKGHHVLYLYGMLQTVDFSKLNNGGAIPTLNRNTLSNITVSEAPQVLQDEYVRIVEPYYQVIRKAKQQILFLVEVRDRLLPKLMSGEIKV